MKVLITGASGFIGRHLVMALNEAGHEVIAAVRNPVKVKQNLDAAGFIKVDFQQDNKVEVWLDRLQGIEVVINAVGIISETGQQTFSSLHHQTPCALFKACEQSGVQRVIQISALGADETATSRYHKTKKAADDCLSALTLDWVILHPSVVYGAGGSSSEFFRALSALPLVPLIGDGRQLMQPIHIDDLSRAVVSMVSPDAESKLHINAVGPLELSFKDMLKKYRTWLGLKNTLQIAVPDIFIKLGAWLGQFIPGSLLTPENIQMLSGGNTAAVAPFTDKTGIAPRSMDVALKQAPATEAERWHASMFFMRPMLRIALGLLWLATGLISLFWYPLADSYVLLAQFGLEGGMATAALYGAAVMDIVLGLALLINYQAVIVGGLQIVVILIYTFLITAVIPEHWLHPFGPITKNIPLMVATLIMMAMERKA